MLRTPTPIALLSSLLGLVISQTGVAHEKHHHAPQGDHSQKASQKDSAVALKRINEAYISTVRPIFAKSCFDCHSSQTRYPWYASLPGAKQLIQSDVEEARKHLDMSSDFPFQGHGSPAEDLEAIRKSVQEVKMPPTRYWILHWSSKLSETEKKTIYQWTEEILRTLR